MNFRDIFDTKRSDGYTYSNEYISFNHRKPYSQSVSLSFSYRFGQTANMKKKMKQQQDSNYNYTGGEEE